MSWMFGNDEDNNPRRPDYRAPRGTGDNGKSSSGCAVLVLGALGAVAAVVTAVTMAVQGMIG